MKASAIIASGAGAPTPTTDEHGHYAACGRRMFEVQDELTKANAFASLLRWILLARDVIDSLDHAGPDVQHALQAAGILYGIDWQEKYEGEGLDWLTLEIVNNTSAIRQAFDPKVQS